MFSALYFTSDVIELVQNGFSTSQLWLTFVAEAAVPVVVVVGLGRAQRPRLGQFGVLSAWAYAASYVAFTGTVIYALVEHSPDYTALSAELGPLLYLPGAVMVVAGIGFGAATWRAGVLPRWTGLLLLVGVVLVAAFQSAPGGLLLVAAGIRDLGLAGMGAALLSAPGSRRSL